MTAHLFSMRLATSRDFFVMIFPHERQEAFLTGHQCVFELWGGVPATITYDTLATAVRRVLEGHAREKQGSQMDGSYGSIHNFRRQSGISF